MKQFFQFAVFLLSALLAAQPAVAGVACTSAPQVACISGCPMAINGVNADRPTAEEPTASECPPNCCMHAFPQAVAPLVESKKQQLAVKVSAVQPTASQAAKTALPFSIFTEDRAASPPLYILNQIFRI